MAGVFRHWANFLTVPRRQKIDADPRCLRLFQTQVER